MIKTLVRTYVKKPLCTVIYTTSYLDTFILMTKFPINVNFTTIDYGFTVSFLPRLEIRVVGQFHGKGNIEMVVSYNHLIM